MSTGADAARETVLIVEDEPMLARGLRDAFDHHGYDVLVAADGEAGVEAALSRRPALIILDLMLPRKSGTEVCRDLRNRNVHIPIIMLTARSEESDRVGGFDAGADDYVTKPFSIRELIARARAVLRRGPSGTTAADQICIGAATVDFKQYVVRNGRHRHPLTPLEVRLVRLFITHPGDVITRERLLNEIWGAQSFPTTRTVDTFMLRLRQKVEPNPRRPVHFLTVYGAGYKFVP